MCTIWKVWMRSAPKYSSSSANQCCWFILSRNCPLFLVSIRILWNSLLNFRPGSHAWPSWWTTSRLKSLKHKKSVTLPSPKLPPPKITSRFFCHPHSISPLFLWNAIVSTTIHYMSAINERKDGWEGESEARVVRSVRSFKSSHTTSPPVAHQRPSVNVLEAAIGDTEQTKKIVTETVQTVWTFISRLHAKHIRKICGAWFKSYVFRLIIIFILILFCSVFSSFNIIYKCFA